MSPSPVHPMKWAKQSLVPCPLCSPELQQGEVTWGSMTPLSPQLQYTHVGSSTEPGPLLKPV